MSLISLFSLYYFSILPVITDYSGTHRLVIHSNCYRNFSVHNRQFALTGFRPNENPAVLDFELDTASHKTIHWIVLFGRVQIRSLGFAPRSLLSLTSLRCRQLLTRYPDCTSFHPYANSLIHIASQNFLAVCFHFFQCS